jgi:hypothetical protein
LGKYGIDNHILRLVLDLVTDRLAELVERCATLGEDIDGPVAINIHEKLGDHLAVEVKLVDGVNNSISNERRRNVSGLGNGVDILISEEGEIGLWEDRPRTRIDR